MSRNGTDGHFDVVIVGSGFGGSVTAFRLAEAGQSVCVLERGRPYPPGSFTRSPYRARESFWDPKRGLHGMYHYWSFRGIDALVSSGLGGGSLIYANVLIRKDEKWFVKEDVDDGGFEYWPVTREDLDPHYDKVEQMMGAQRYPMEHEPYASTPKTLAFLEAARRNGMEAYHPKLAVTFANEGRPPAPGEPIPEGPYPNLHGRPRTTCQLVGECDVGCNFGAKNTLDHNYLSAAKHHGAEIRTLCDVRTIEPRPGGGYMVGYAALGEDEQPGLRTLSADRLVISAGTLGSTNLLLRNRAAFPKLSRKLGTRFCGNGDLLTLILNCSEESGGRRIPRIVDPGYGPVITTTARMPDAADEGGEGRGFYLQDAGYPQHVAWVLHLIAGPKTIWRWRKIGYYLIENWLKGSPETDVTGQLADLLQSSELSAGGLPLLAMGRDVPDGRMHLRNGRLDLDWKRAKSDAYFERLRNTSRGFAEALGGKYRDNPIWFLKRVITVHPLGGSPMGRHPGEGVVDSYGEVFGYPGLHVLDGSIMPGPVGPNPSLTIAATADRACDRIIDPSERPAATLTAA